MRSSTDLCCVRAETSPVPLGRRLLAGVVGQAVFDPDAFGRFMQSASKLGVPVMAGIILLKSAAMARFMNANIAGVNVPKRLIDQMAAVSKEDRPARSVEIAAEIAREVRGLCQGVHVMSFGWGKKSPRFSTAQACGARRYPDASRSTRRRMAAAAQSQRRSRTS